MSKTGVALFVYNRPYHTKKVLEGLKKNNIKKLYIFADGLKKEEHRKDFDELRSLIDSIDWCETEIIKQSENKGLANSITYGINYVLERHERVISLEDDCVPTPNYLDYMEQCFDKYEDNEKVMSVAGYSWPVDIPENYDSDIYFVYRLSSWGWGTWRRAWKYFKRDRGLYEKIKNSYDLYMKVNRAGRDLFPMLETEVKKGLDSWAVYWAVNIAINDGVCINPVVSKINNVGFDSSGIHMDDSDRMFEPKQIDFSNKKDFLLSEDISMDSNINYQLEQLLFYTVSGKEGLKRYRSYYEILNKWVSNLNSNKKIIDYLNSNNVKSVAIYGMGELGKNLFNELKNENIDLICIDRKSIEKVQEHKVDIIIVTPVYDFGTIKKSICNLKIKSKVVSLSDIFFKTSY